jgi:hypothetical protein
VFNNPMAQQRPVLHQSEHTRFPPFYSLPHDPPTLRADRGLGSWN